MAETPLKEIAWDLSPLFPSASPEAIEKRKKQIDAKVDDFVQAYRGKIADLVDEPQKLAQMLETYEEFHSDYSEFAQFCHLSFAANMTKPKNQQLFNMMQEYRGKFVKKLTFFEL